ncbi:uncharacterized protein METZ01_LOCUS431211 [marine metagenome]|uniref:Uncharacterized protein n=1 Tax=marine metagenome TaxID=408172 RepID=A0A382Y4U9_9ZZZZ
MMIAAVFSLPCGKPDCRRNNPSFGMIFLRPSMAYNRSSVNR